MAKSSKSKKKASETKPAKSVKVVKSKKGGRPVHILPPSENFLVFLPKVVGGLCSEVDCDHHTQIKDRRVFIDTDEEHGHADYHTLVEIAGPENVHPGQRPEMVMVEHKDGSLRWAEDRGLRYFPSIESFGIHVLGIIFDRDGIEDC